MIPATITRVRAHTADSVKRDIRRRTLRNLERYVSASQGAIEQRLRALACEWDIERTLEANAAAATLVGSGLAIAVNRKWIALPLIVGGFLFQHAVQGWCPPMIWFRRMGVRTQSEIELERDALRAIRGDFKGLPVRSGEVIDMDQTLRTLEQRREGIEL